MTEINRHYLETAKKNFQSIKKLGDKVFPQIKDKDFFWSPDEESNSMAIIIRHLYGNMLSRWTDFLTSDGEKPDRKRDEEFERLFYTDKDDVIEKWNSGWKCLFDALDSLNENDLMKEVTIRGQHHTVIEAIERQINHYSYHVGQIVYIGKHLEGEKWISLSVPRNKSDKFNDEMKKRHGKF